MDIKSMTLDELKDACQQMGEKPFRAKQLYDWMHHRLAGSYDEMTNLSLAFREKLKEQYPLTCLEKVQVQESKIDGTRKYLFRLSDGNVIESVWMKYHHGNSVCISSQVGCRMGCRFCASTIGGLVRCLTPSEMLDQIYRIWEDTGERVSNLVVMGTGGLAGYGVPALLLFAAFKIHPVIGFLLEVLWCWQIPATKCLKDESMKVYQKLKENDLPGARYAVSMIVGRDTENLSETGVTKAAVETIAENTSDGVIAPLLFLALGGPALGFLYKSINTMDSMVGYKNDKYLYFGRCAAKLDDVVNYIPARISAWLMILASACERMNWKNAEKIYKRDRYCHASPNSAQTEAVMAGALEVQLAGDAVYFGKVVKKPTIGDDIRPVEAEDIKRANHLMYLTSFLGLVFFAGIRALFLFL